MSLVCSSEEPTHLEKLRYTQGLIPPSHPSALCYYKPKRFTRVLWSESCQEEANGVWQSC